MQHYKRLFLFFSTLIFVQTCFHQISFATNAEDPPEAEGQRDLNTAPAERELVPIVQTHKINMLSVGEINPDNQYDNLADATIAKGSQFRALGIGNRCTSAMVGPNVLLTAAHCVDGRGNPAVVQDVSFSAIADTSKRLEYKCTMHPKYAKRPYRGGKERSSHDIALCLLSNEADLPAGDDQLFEVIDTTIKPVVDSDILLTGFGCTGVSHYEFVDDHDGKIRYLASTSGISDHRLRIGNAKISHLRDEPRFQNDVRYQGYFESHGFTNGEGAKLCKGDSGGPVFTAASVDNPNGSRRIIGINSGFYSAATDAPPAKIISNLTDLNEKTNSEFIDTFKANNPTARICGSGLTAGTNRCRK